LDSDYLCHLVYQRCIILLVVVFCSQKITNRMTAVFCFTLMRASERVRTRLIVV
jgi:hypothetical protein